MLAFLALTGVGLFAVAKATQPPEITGTDNDPTVAREPPGIDALNKAIQAQDARETGFIGSAFNRKSNSIYAWNQTVMDPGKVSITRMNDFKSTIADDHSSYTSNNLKNIFDHDYHRPRFPRTRTFMPLIGVPHAGAEIKSGQNIDGNIALLSSNPYTFPENGHQESKLNNNTGWILKETYGSQGQVNYDPHGEVRMAFMGLRNPWRLGGVQQRMHSQYLPPDKDQKTGHVPIAHPQKIFDVGNRPTQVVAPPYMQKTATVFNRQLRMGKNH